MRKRWGREEEKMGKRGGREMENYIDFKDVVGEVFLVLFFTGIFIGAIIANKLKGSK